VTTEDEYLGTEGARSRRRRLPALEPAEWAALLIAAIIAVSLLWLAAEQHYQGCVESAAARTDDATGELTPLVRERLVAGCSRSPL
jgi:hypothetical protein